jgi:hypothetical protein
MRTYPLTTPRPTSHFALNGNALSPDTDKIAKYKELSQCSNREILAGIKR